MVGRRHKQRIEIDHIHAQFLQIIHLIKNALQIAAVKFAHAHSCGIFIPVLHSDRLIPDILVLVRQHVIGGITVVETIHIDLIKHRSLRPIRRFKARNHMKIIVLVCILRNTPHVIKTGKFACMYFKIITHLLILKLDRYRIVIEIIVRFCLEHEVFHIIVYKKHFINIIFGRPKTHGNFTVGAWLHR